MMQFALASFVGTLTVAAPRILPMLLFLLGATVAEALCVSWASRSVQWRTPVRIAGDSRMETRSPGAAVCAVAHAYCGTSTDGMLPHRFGRRIIFKQPKEKTGSH
ncbi:MAG: hypothetical protein V7606_2694 [Burkholderiales bacterium]